METRTEQMIKALHGLVSINSVSGAGPKEAPYGEGPAKALDYVLELCDSFGFRTKNCDGQVGYAEIGQGDELIGILGHLDVVPAGGGWDFEPFACTRDNGRLYGRGVTDDKGPVIATLFAMKALLDSGVPLAKRIRFIFGLAEEVGDWPDMEYYKRTEELPAYGFTPDANFPAIYGEKGIARFNLSMSPEKAGVVEITGGEAANMVADRCAATLRAKTGGTVLLEATGRSAHGSLPWDGENAISKLMAEIAARNDLEPCPLAEWYNALIGFDLYGQRAGCAMEDAESGPLTLNVGMARTTAEAVTLSIDIRYPVTKTLEEVRRGLAAALAPYGVALETDSSMKPVYMDKNGPVLQKLLAAYRAVTGDETSQPEVIGGGTYARAMDNIVAFGPMLPGREGTEHQKNEYILEEDFVLLEKIYHRALLNLLAADA